MKTPKLLALVLALMLIFSLFAACGKANTESAPPVASSNPEVSKEPEPSAEPLGATIKIGHICDLTGNEALTGEEAKRSIEFAVKNLGGVFANHPIEVITVDGKGTTQDAIDAAKQLVEKEKVVAIFGPTQAGQKSAVAEYMEGVGVPLIFYNGSPDMLLAGKNWLVGAGGANSQLPSVMADYAYNELKYRTVNIITIDNIGFRGFSDVFTASFEKLGGKVIDSKYAPFGSDWSPYLASLKDADAIMAWVTGGDSINLWKTWYDMGIKDKMPMTPIIQSAFADYNILNAINATNPKLADAIVGAFAPTMYTYDIDNADNKAFVDAWKTEFGNVPATNLPGQVYEAILLFKAALEATNGDAAPKVLIDALFAANITSPCGTLSFGAGTNAATKDVYICKLVKLDDGTFNSQAVKAYNSVPPSGYSK